GRQRPRRALHGDLGVRAKTKLRAYRRKHPLQLGKVEDGGRPTAEVDRVHLRLEWRRSLTRNHRSKTGATHYPVAVFNIRAYPIRISGKQRPRHYSRGEVAEAALGAA